MRMLNTKVSVLVQGVFFVAFPEKDENILSTCRVRLTKISQNLGEEFECEGEMHFYKD